MNKQQGFTLIELMIVVAVIGVLSAIAIPAYQKYVAKAEVASALATMTGLKTNVEAFTVENGEFPAAQSEEDLGSPADIALGQIAFQKHATKGVGAIVFTFKTDSVSALLSDKIFKLSRNAEGTWTCENSSTSGKQIDEELLPKNCKAKPTNS